MWYGLLTPAKTPKETVSRLAGWFTAAMQARDVKARLVSNGIYPAVMCGAEYGTYLRNQSDEYGRAILDANINP